MTAYNYPHNVINEGVPLKDCSGQYCRQLPIPVFPTAFYETVICLLLTAFLFFLRSRLTVPGTIFAAYLILNRAGKIFYRKDQGEYTV
jgi:prolipoprotein diacylglyceryltransferase